MTGVGDKVAAERRDKQEIHVVLIGPNQSPLEHRVRIRPLLRLEILM